MSESAMVKIIHYMHQDSIDAVKLSWRISKGLQRCRQ